MEQWQIVLMGMDVPMLLWLSRAGFDQRVMDKGGWWFALYACVMIAGVPVLYLVPVGVVRGMLGCGMGAPPWNTGSCS